MPVDNPKPLHQAMHEAAMPVKKLARKRRKWPWIVGSLVLIGLVAAFSGRKKEKIAEITVEKIERRDVTQVVSATGKIQPAIEVKISPEVAGEIISLPVEEGQVVKKGDPLIKIKPDTYQAQVEQYEAALNGAKADNLQRKAQLIKAQQDLRRQQDLFEKRIVAQGALDEALAARDAADASYNASIFAIKRAEGQLSQAREDLKKTEIFAPMNGTISTLPSKLGERVVATGQFEGTEVMRVANLADMEVRAEVNENDVVAVKVNDPVSISIDAYPGRTFTGRVKHIANTATVKGENTTEEVTNFEVKVQVMDPGVPLRPGMSATADIKTATVTHVLTVPIQSVTVRSKNKGESVADMNKKKDEERKQSGSTATDTSRADRQKLQRVVFLKEGDKAVMKAVTTGIADNTYIEIQSGVNGGEDVVSGSYGAISRDLKDGAKVKIEKPKDQDKK